MKDKTSKIKMAQKTIKAAIEYKNLPMEIRKELEAYNNAHASKLDEIENLCKKTLDGQEK